MPTFCKRALSCLGLKYGHYFSNSLFQTTRPLSLSRDLVQLNRFDKKFNNKTPFEEKKNIFNLGEMICFFISMNFASYFNKILINVLYVQIQSFDKYLQFCKNFHIFHNTLHFTIHWRLCVTVS